MVKPQEVPITPVQIAWGDFSILTTVSGLADCLMRQWPAPTDGDAYLTALMVCNAVLSASEDDAPDDARQAFIEAARVAGLSIVGDDYGLDF